MSHEQNQPSVEQGNFESLGEVTGAERPQAPEFNKATLEAHIKRAEAIVAAESSKAEKPVLPTIVDDRPQLIDSAVKALRMRQNLKTVQTKLKPAERSFSKLVHQPLVQKVSESASTTIARPSGILGGGIAAFLGCLGYQLLVRHYGLPYNFSFFLLFFVIGFVIGVSGEYAFRRLRRIAN